MGSSSAWDSIYQVMMEFDLFVSPFIYYRNYHLMVNLCRNKGYKIPQLHLNCAEMVHSNPKKIDVIYLYFNGGVLYPSWTVFYNNICCWFLSSFGMRFIMLGYSTKRIRALSYLHLGVSENRVYVGTTGGLFVCGPKPMLEAISNVLETICFCLGNYITNFGNYIWKFVP